MNTERFNYIPHGMLHTEGGWPKDVDATEKDQTTRWRKKVEKDEEYIRQVRAPTTLTLILTPTSNPTPRPHANPNRNHHPDPQFRQVRALGDAVEGDIKQNYGASLLH